MFQFSFDVCAWVSQCVRVCPSGFVQAITSTFIHRFQNDLAQLLSIRSRSAIWNICSGRLMVKVTLEGQMIKWSWIELVRAITSIFIHGFFLNKWAQLFSLRSNSAIWKICSGRLIGWMADSGLTALWDSISVYIGPFSRERSWSHLEWDLQCISTLHVVPPFVLRGTTFLTSFLLP